MLYTVRQFCEYVETDLNALVEEVAGINRNVSDEEKKAYKGSYPVVSEMLSKAMQTNPAIGEAHISSTQMLLEYKLPAASAWCDLVILGDSKTGKHQVLIIELKNYLKKSEDYPGQYEGLMSHNGKEIQHPADQVKGYTQYCRRFHSTVQEEGADVMGCVYFTQPIDLGPYKKKPNETLTEEYPLYNKDMTDSLAEYVTERIDHGNEGFAVKFINGYYKQDRNILRQVAENLQSHAEVEKPFVLLDAQRLGFNLVMDTLQKRVKDGKKEVIIVEGPPGSGKSAVAINVWIEAVETLTKELDRGNIVFVTTSSSQKDNWCSIFNRYGEKYHASDLTVSANSFNPGMNGARMKNELLPIMADIDEKYVDENNEYSLKYSFFRDYLHEMQKRGMTTNYKENLHFLSVVDEAHALINPTAEGFRTNKTAGWCFQMGPQAYHIINESQISVFFTDGKQSFRDNESTSVDDLKAWAKELGANVTTVSLAGMQFRCAGSAEYVEWVERLFTLAPVLNAAKWRKNFDVEIVDNPSDMEEFLRKYLAEDKNCTARILSSYTRKWNSSGQLKADHDDNAEYDFDLEDKDSKRWQRYWNNPEGYNIFVQADKGSMAEDPLSEVGCPYVVRGFDYDRVGLLWLDDIFVRDGKWYVSIKNVQETAIGSTRSKAVKEQKDAIKNKLIKGRAADIDVVPAHDPRFPAATNLFNTVVQAYRILLTRAIKGVTIYIQDKETREYVKSLINTCQ